MLVHLELHDTAKEAVVAYERGDIKLAEQCLEKIGMCSKRVFTLMGEIKNYYLKNFTGKRFVENNYNCKK